jgi:hypothetical protein
MKLMLDRCQPGQGKGLIQAALSAGNMNQGLVPAGFSGAIPAAKGSYDAGRAAGARPHRDAPFRAFFLDLRYISVRSAYAAAAAPACSPAKA